MWECSVNIGNPPVVLHRILRRGGLSTTSSTPEEVSEAASQILYADDIIPRGTWSG
jgi:hypothetical protein